MTNAVAETKENVMNMDNEEINLMDRCDNCAAQAFVRAYFMNGSLQFCAHHFRENEEAVREQSLNVLDVRDRINSKPSVSANV